MNRVVRWTIAGAAVLLLLAALWVLFLPPGASSVGEAGSRETLSRPQPMPAMAGAPGSLATRRSDPSNRWTVRAELTDAQGEPLRDVRVSLWCLHPDASISRTADGLRPDAEGWVEGPGCAHRVCAELHTRHWIPASPWVLRPGEVEHLVARPLPRIDGRLEDEHGVPLPGVGIGVRSPADERDPFTLLPVTVTNTTTDDEGAFSIPLIVRPPCGPCEEVRGLCDDDVLGVLPRVLLVANPKGSTAIEEEIDVDALAARGYPTVVLRSSGTAQVIEGSLVDAQGRAYPRAYVLAKSQERSFEQRRADVVDGQFVLEGIGGGNYDLRALQDGQQLAASADVRPGAYVDWIGDRPAVMQDVVLEVRDDEAPVAAAAVDGPAPFADLTTDRDGRTGVVSALSGQYSVRVRVPGRDSTVRLRVEIEPPSTGASPVVVPLELHDRG